MTSTFKNRWYADGGYAELLRIAIPLILSTGSWSLQQFIDRMFLTWYSPNAIAAAMPAGLVNWSVISIFVGTAAYVNTFVAQYYGAQRFDRIGASVWQGLYLALFAEVVALCIIPFAAPIFSFAGHTPVVQEMEVTYFRTLCLGMGPLVISTAASCFFSGRGKTWVLVWVNVATTCVNAILDYYLIFGHWHFPEMGIKGAGLATVLSACFSAIAYLVVFLLPRFRKRYATHKTWRLNKGIFMRLIRYGVPNGIHHFLDGFAFTLFIIMVGRMGIVELAATNIAFNINALAFMPLIGFGIAVSTLVGQWLGREKPEIAERSTWTGFWVALFYTVLFVAAYLFLPKLFLAPFALQADNATFANVRAIAAILLRFVAFYSVFDMLNIIFAAAIKGAGDTRFVMVTNIALSWFILLVPSYLAVSVFKSGIYSMWTAVSAYIVILGIVFLLRFLKGKWKTMRVIEEISRPGITKIPECPTPEAEL